MMTDTLLLWIGLIQQWLVFAFNLVKPFPKNATFRACVHFDDDNTIIVRIWPWIGPSLFSQFPCLILIVSHLCMLCVLTYRYCRYCMLRVRPDSGVFESRISSFTLSSFAFVMWFLITTLPLMVFLIVRNMSDSDEKLSVEQITFPQAGLGGVPVHAPYRTQFFRFHIHFH